MAVIWPFGKAEQIHKMTTIFPQKDNLFQPRPFWVKVGVILWIWSALQNGHIKKYLSIYNILQWVAWMMGQTNRQPSKYYFFSWFLAKFFAKFLSMYRGSPVSAIFGSPANRTIGKTALIGDWFSTKIAIWDFWIFKVPLFGSFSCYFNDC